MKFLNITFVNWSAVPLKCNYRFKGTAASRPVCQALIKENPKGTLFVEGSILHYAFAPLVER